MSVHAAPSPGDGLALTIRGRPYPILLPKLRDPRLHLAATITSLQVIGQVGFHFQLSIAQILVSLGTCAVLEIAIAAWRQGVLLWPASALLTGNGVAFVLRVPHTAHGDWWTLRGWWVFAATAAVSLLSKHVLVWRGEHIFNPSNIGLVICFLALGRTRAVPLDFWWGPMSAWLVIALIVIVSGGFAILTRLSLLRVALGFWAAFAAALAALAAAGHAMTARWHLGPITGVHFWSVLVTSPEVLVFLFFMITDPKTAPRAPRARLLYAVSLGLLAALLIAPTTTEFASKVALLASLAVVCVAMPVVRLVRVRVRLAYAAPVALAAYVAVLVGVTNAAPGRAHGGVAASGLPTITILPSHGLQTQLDPATARVVATSLVAAVPAAGEHTIRLQLEQGTDQGPPLAVAQVGATTYVLHQSSGGWAVGSRSQATVVSPGPVVTGYRLRNVAPSVGLDFRQGSFRFGMSNDYRAMMGGGVCWIDYNGDGFLDLFAVNSYSSADAAAWAAHGGLPRTQLFENVHGRFRNVSHATNADLPVQGDGCVAADLNGDGRTDLVVTTTSGVQLLWNTGHGTFRRASLARSGWYAGAAVADVNGDGRPDLFVAGYSDPNEPVPGSLAGFPTNIAAVRDLLYVNEGGGRFREAGLAAGLEPFGAQHGLGAEFLDYNHDGRPDLYVANDEDPNQLYENVPWPGGVKADPARLGFRFEERARPAGVADPYAGMGIASTANAQGRLRLFVTNSRREPSAAFSQLRDGAFANARPGFDRALGTGFAGWGASFVDLRNTGRPALVVAAGGIPVKSLTRDAEPIRVLGPRGVGYGDAVGALGPNAPSLNGRGLAAADVDNDGRMEIAVNTIGGGLALLRPQRTSGHWIDVRFSRFAPGAVVTAVLPDGRRLLGQVQAGSSYLSSEDPRVHLGLGRATRISELDVRYPFGGENRLRNVAGDRIVDVRVPAPAPVEQRSPAAACARPHVSIARYWNETAVDVLRLGNASAPVQARDLLDLSLAMRDASAKGEAAISYAAYRLLLWRASFGSNLDRTFARLTHALGALCYSPDVTRTRGSSPAAVGNRVAARAIAAGLHDGSLEALHYTDAGYVAPNAPLDVTQAVSTVHDPAFWQPLAHGRRAQRFVDAQWGGVRRFATAVPIARPAPRSLARSAVSVLRATANTSAPAAAVSTPVAWNHVADTLPRTTLATDVRRLVLLNGALNDAAVSAWRAKRAYQAPRPISIIRYLAFNDRLPLVPGLVERQGSVELVRLRGRWVPGAQWTPPAPTPPSPGGISEQSAFAFAANEVLTALTGRSFERLAQQASGAAVANGIETPADAAAGRALGTAVGKRVLLAP